MTVAECIRCKDAPAVDELGYCGHCHWAVHVEVEEGLAELGSYMRHWAEYEAWCEAHGVLA